MTRDEAIKWLQGIEERYFNGGDEVYDKKRREAVRMAIESLEQYEMAFEHGWTAAESEYRKILERKHGEWIESDFGWKCSICGNTSVMWQRTYNFCPNCGADMRKILPKP